MDENQEDVHEEVIQSEQEEQVRQPQKPSDSEMNWRRANEIMNYQQRQIEELNKQIHASRTPAPTPKIEEPDEFDTLAADDLLTVDQAKRLAEKQAKRYARQTYEEFRKEEQDRVAKTAQEKKAQEFQQKLSRLNVLEEEQRRVHEDFDSIVDTYVLPLINSNPAYKQLVMEADNPAEEAYMLGQMLARRKGSAPSVTSPKAEKVLKNANRPVSSATLGAPLKGQKDGSQLKPGADVWAMSQQYARGAI